MKLAYDLYTLHTTILQKKKTMSMNHTATISINYKTLQPEFETRIAQARGLTL